MTDFSAARATHGSNLPHRKRREVVVVHVALGLVRRKGVELLLHAERAKRRNREDLGLASLEEAASMGPWQETNLDVQRADLLEAPAVSALAFGKDFGAHRFLDCLEQSFAYLRFTELLFERLGEFFPKGLILVASLARCRRDKLLESVCEMLLHRRHGVAQVRGRSVFGLNRCVVLRHLALDRVDRAIRLHGRLDRFENGVLGHLLRAGFHHYDGIVCPGHDDVHVPFV